MVDQSIPAPASTDPPRFPRGFLVSDLPIGLPVPGWVSASVAGLWIWRAPDVPLGTARAGARFVVVVGHIVDTETWCVAESAISRAVQALARSEEAFLDVTDAWSGRYLVIFGSDGSRHAMTDATGMRSAFYPLDGSFVLASHARLVARLSGAEPSRIYDVYREFMRARTRRLVTPMPGRSTPWAGVVQLTANTVLDIDPRRLRRIFPRRPLPALSSIDAGASIAPRLRRQMSALVDSGRPVAVSMTAGIDSRVSVAASGHVRAAVRYFTYRDRDLQGNAWDVATAASIARSLRLTHSVLQVPPAVEPPALDAALREATLLSHARRNISAYRAAFPPDTIHVRSNVGEVGRCHFRRTRHGAGMSTSAADLTPRDLARMWAADEVPEPLIEPFDEWMAATRFRDATGVDGLDLFYWEHRMSCWHANVLLESDFAFDTHVLFNSRWILEQMLSVRLEDRCRAAVFGRLVDELWPELAAWPMGSAPSRRRRTWRSALAGLRRRVVSARS